MFVILREILVIFHSVVAVSSMLFYFNVKKHKEKFRTQVKHGEFDLDRSKTLIMKLTGRIRFYASFAPAISIYKFVLFTFKHIEPIHYKSKYCSSKFHLQFVAVYFKTKGHK